MKKLSLFLLIFFLVAASSAQTSFGEIKLETESDYASAESKVVNAADYLFTTKYDTDDLERLYATELVVKWMAGTPNFTFELDEKFTKPFKEEPELLNLYMAAMARFAIENREKAADVKNVAFNAIKAVLEYSNKSSNNLKQSGELKKMSAALKKGELEKYLGI